MILGAHWQGMALLSAGTIYMLHWAAPQIIPVPPGGVQSNTSLRLRELSITRSRLGCSKVNTACSKKPQQSQGLPRS